MVTYDRTDPNHWYNLFTRTRQALEVAGYYREADKLRDEIRRTVSDIDCRAACHRWQRRLARALELDGPNPNPGFSRRMPEHARNVT